MNRLGLRPTGSNLAEMATTRTRTASRKRAICVLAAVAAGTMTQEVPALHAPAGNEPQAAGFVVGPFTQLRRPRCTTRQVLDSRIGQAGPNTLDLDELTDVDPQFRILQLFAIIASAAVPYAAWWFYVVPNRRREIAKSKRRGEVREYLEELAEAPEDSRKAEKWMYDRYLREGKLVSKERPAGMPEAIAAVEGNLQEALPGGGFWSFDNPVFVYLVLVAGFVATQLLSQALSGS